VTTSPHTDGPRRVVRVRTEVAALPRAFDYAVPDAWSSDVTVGTRVRAPLHGRSVRGWVVEDRVVPPDGVGVLPLKSWLGWGPPASVVELADWAAWRWAGPSSFFLRTASPATIVHALPTPPTVAPPPDPATATWASDLWARVIRAERPAVVRLPPATDLLDLVLAAADDVASTRRPGSVLVLVPSTGWAERLTARLVRRGRTATMGWPEARAGWPIVVGSRAGAWLPVPEVAAALVLDAHDAAYREESAPTYVATEVVMERARRVGAPCALVSPVPPVALHTRPVVSISAHEERAGWAALEVVDRRGADPRTGMFSEEFVRLARAVLDDPAAVSSRGPLVCVYNRKGGARLLACSHCGELARCTRCGAATARRRDEDVFHCPRCAETRPVVCTNCGRLKMKTLRAGVSRLREELAALLGAEVDEVAGPPTDQPDTAPASAGAPVVIGTEAVLHRVRRAAAVVCLDVDLHLLAPRLSSTEDTFGLLGRASRLVGGRGAGPRTARVQVQTRVPDHAVLVAAAAGEPAAVLAEEVEVRRVSGLPPFVAMARLSGPLAAGYAAALSDEASVRATTDGTADVSALAEDTFVVQAPDHTALGDLLAAVERPPGRGLRVEVDPQDL
jgi:primosomal protein N' (replication factor Y)